MSAQDRIVKLLKTTDGRDKLYKQAAGACKIAAYNSADKETVKKLNAIAKSIGDCRSLMRMCKWIQKHNEVVKEVDSINQGKVANVNKGYIKVFRILADMGYIVGDNLQWLGKYGLLTLDHKTMAMRSKVFQFWGYVAACYLQAFEILIHAGKAGTFTDKDGKAKILKLVADFCDLLCALATVGYIPSFQPTSRTTGTLALISATIATRTNWTNTSK
eukprot:TRINITY_DN1012_c2_g1_i1.p1 TRINITY_DN1012_c2_g1~~TRINITY_DN1012_c2_g1_i1.p1  ORF type:complete len:233 (+),score=50.67 TRINITY_DN1012_c2_g1_i1:51-701(+)